MHQIITTADGSNTLALSSGRTYHSQHGALQESLHVFIQNGLAHIAATHTRIDIMEVGFGTGLNFLLTADYAQQHPHLTICYTALEPNYVPIATMQAMDYARHLQRPQFFDAFVDWYKLGAYMQPFAPTDNISLQLINTELHLHQAPQNSYDLVYYDAFGNDEQPEMWLPHLLAHSAQALRTGGVWVSYAARGVIKRTLRTAGCTIQKLPGAAGKREMMRAVKV
jgi:tRNA U34 5-methylaminomethyl-2-thiouridine-forming methyltransferase MnmC